MKLFSILIVAIILSNSCNSFSRQEKELSDALNKHLCLDKFEIVQQGNNLMSFGEFRYRYDFISVVYLLNGCEPCYPKFIEWHHKMDSLATRDDYTVLFIIRGDNYGDFMAKVLDLEFIESPYHVVMDMDYKFMNNNKHIPKWIIDSSVLIDQENKIKLIGAPYSTPQMTELFYDVCGK